MHTEAQIRKAVRVLLEEYGQLNTSEIKEHLNEVLIFDEDDLTPSSTRPGEVLIQQRIGNVVSHQSDSVKTYAEGYSINKGESPALWNLLQGTSGHETVLQQDEVRRRRTRLGNHSRRKYRKVNWEEVNERQTTLGTAGEEFVYQSELDRVNSIDISLAQRVQHLSAMQGDGFGYDVLSIDENGNSVFIEVKTTSSADKYAPFYMSINERKFFEENIDANAYVYRVYNFNLESRTGEIMIITARDLIENYDFDPISFKVTHKR